MRALVGASRADVVELGTRLDALANEASTLHRALQQAERAQEHMELRGRIAPTMAWVQQATVPEDELVSVILATRDRANILERAIRSVVAQSYTTWELVVVDDASTDRTPEVLRSFDDPRIRAIRGEGRGVSAARNRGLEEARGALIAYLDDDNTMHHEWLKGVVWAFLRNPDAQCLYGARLVDDPRLAGIEGDGAFAAAHLEPFDRRRLERGNFIDIGTIAHRAGLPEAGFDEELTTLVDWDLILRLTQARPPLVVPAIAILYTTDQADRLTDHPDKEQDDRHIRSKVEARPLRVLSFNAMFPLLSESYMEDEMEALAAQGVDLAFCHDLEPATPVPVRRRVFSDLELAVREFGPDLLLLYWTTFAESRLPRLEALGLPFGVRGHSFDFDPERTSRLLAHPLCLGVWLYPHHVHGIPGASSLPSMFSSFDRMPQPPSSREDLVMSAYAGLPKREWPLLLAALGRVPRAERRVMIAVTNEYERFPEELRAMLARMEDPPRLEVNVPRQEVLALASRAAAIVYTLDPREPFGNPMSVVEGLCGGASVIVPDRPEAREMAGPAARFYSTEDDIVRHLREVLAGGPAVDAERSENRRHGIERFCDDTHPKRLLAEIEAALHRPDGVAGRA